MDFFGARSPKHAWTFVALGLGTVLLECGCKVEEPNGKGVDGDGVFPKVSPRDTVE